MSDFSKNPNGPVKKAGEKELVKDLAENQENQYPDDNKMLLEAFLGATEDEDPDPGKEFGLDKEQKKTAKEVEDSAEEDVEEEQELEDEEQEDSDEDLEEEEEKQLPRKKAKAKEEEKEVEFSEETVKVLKPFNGDVEGLAKAYKSLVQKMEATSIGAKVVEALEVDEANVNAVVKDLQKVSNLFIRHPKFMDTVIGIMNGKVPEGFNREVKTMQDFMPENEHLDMEDAFNNPNSESWKARVKFNEFESQQNLNQRQFVEDLTSLRRESDSQVAEGFDSRVRAAKENMRQVHAFAKEEYGADSELIEEFKEKMLAKLDVNGMKLLFHYFAKTKGIQTTIEKKLKKNKGKSFQEKNVRGEDLPKNGYDVAKEKDAEYASVFTDW